MPNVDHRRKVLLAAADVYRPAAIEQLRQLGEKIEIKVEIHQTIEALC